MPCPECQRVPQWKAGEIVRLPLGMPGNWAAFLEWASCQEPYNAGISDAMRGVLSREHCRARP